MEHGGNIWNTNVFPKIIKIKGINFISIDSDPIQCNYIKKIINAIQVLPHELQEVGLNK